MGRASGIGVVLSLSSLLAAGAGSGCKRAPAPAGDSPLDAATAPSRDVATASSSGDAAAIFSAPIAAARVVGTGASAASRGDVVAAGLVVATHSVTATRLDGSGKSAWTRAVIPDVAWSADADLHALSIAAGTAILWRGLQGKKNSHVAVVLGPDGRTLDGPVDVGSFVCATDDGLAWSESAPNGATRIHLRTYARAQPSGAPADAGADETGPGMTDDFTLTCGSHRAYAVIEGDEGTPTKVFAVGAGAGRDPIATLAPRALGNDEERDLFFWANGDELGLVRVANGGNVQAVDVRGAAITPLHADKARILPEDDVVGVDADPKQVVLVTTHDESDACPDGRGGSSVHALRIPRRREGAGLDDRGGESASTLRLAPSACGRDVGPFWTNPLGPSLYVAWSERASRPEKTSAPITGLAYRVLDDGAATARIAQAADAITDAGCDENRCYAVALVRDPGADGMKPEALRVLSYP